MDPIVQRFMAGVSDAGAAVLSGRTADVPPEQAFRMGVEAILPEIFGAWGIAFMPTMERATVTRRRIDMLCGRVVTEYKAPGVLGSAAGYAAATEQAQDYLQQL